jgi:hypothetical protein
MITIRRQKKGRYGQHYWEYKIYYKDIFSAKTKVRKRGGFRSKEEAESAAKEILGYLRMGAGS